jgi:hypothetical protein
MARLIIVFFLIVVIVFSSSGEGQREMSHAWETVRPDVIQVMDGVYAAIRNFVAGTGSSGVDDNAPDANFDEVITMWLELF